MTKAYYCLSVKLNETETAHLEALATRWGKSLSAVVRELISEATLACAGVDRAKRDRQLRLPRVPK